LVKLGSVVKIRRKSRSWLSNKILSFWNPFWYKLITFKCFFKLEVFLLFSLSFLVVTFCYLFFHGHCQVNIELATFMLSWSLFREHS
jgi:hypothetical protein